MPRGLALARDPPMATYRVGPERWFRSHIHEHGEVLTIPDDEKPSRTAEPLDEAAIATYEKHFPAEREKRFNVKRMPAAVAQRQTHPALLSSPVPTASQVYGSKSDAPKPKRPSDREP